MPLLPPVVKAEPGAARGAVKKPEPEDGTADWKPPRKQLKAHTVLATYAWAACTKMTPPDDCKAMASVGK